MGDIWFCGDTHGSLFHVVEHVLSAHAAGQAPGAVILLHSVSPDNAAALGDIIDWARKQGYEFRSLEQLPN